MAADKKANITFSPPSVTVQKNQDAVISFHIDEPAYTTDQSIETNLSPSEIEGGTIYSAPIDKSAWKKISKLEVK